MLNVRTLEIPIVIKLQYMSNFGRCIGKFSYVSSLPARMKEEDIGSQVAAWPFMYVALRKGGWAMCLH